MSEKQHIYFIGIGGIGMSGLAEYYIKNGYEVSGSDMTQSHITDRLKSLGASIIIGHNSENISKDINTVVYTSAVEKSNPELKKAAELNLRVLKRAELLGEIVNNKFVISVAGTHGKTTTTAMIGKVLIDAGLDPLIFVGGNVKLFDGGAARLGKGKYAVVEADEYDRSFLTLKSDIAVITNIDADHLDIYTDLNDIKDTFKKFCDNSKDGSKIIYYGDDENIKSFINSVKSDRISYGFKKDNSLKIEDYKTDSFALHYTIVNSHNSYPDINLNVIGKHNALNSAAAFAVSKSLGIKFDTYKNSIAGFTTVDRRLQLKYDNGNVKVFDDYAHHPIEIKSSLNGLKDSFKGKLITVFQPHLFSRTRDFYKEFAESLSIADEVILLEIYPARERAIEGVTSKLIFDELIKLKVKTEYIKEKKEVNKYLLKNINSAECVVFQGAGDITNICDEFVNQLKNNN